MRLPSLSEVFEGRYEILAVLGQGGFACVYRARDLSIDRDVALKVLAPSQGEYSLTSSARFLREARLLADLQDPHTLTLYDFGEAESGLLWMACEFVDGQELKQLIADRGPLGSTVTHHILVQLLSSLREAHSKGLFHRDIKPANILIYTYDGDPYRAKLLDFGLAKSVDVAATRITRKGSITGTPRYMAPEQVLGDAAGPPGDVYSLGLVAYEMLTGRPAIDAADMTSLLVEQVQGPPIRLPEECAEPHLRSVVERMSMRSLEERFPNAESVQNALRPAKPRAPRAPAVPPKQETSRTAPAKPVPVYAASLVGLAVLAAAIVALVVSNSDPPVEEPVRSINALVAAPPKTRPRTVLDAAAADTSVSDDVSTTDAGLKSSGCAYDERLTATQRALSIRLPSGAKMWRFAPRSYEPRKPHPLVVILGGGADQRYAILGARDAHTFTQQSGILEKAEKHGFLVAALDDADAAKTVEAIGAVSKAFCVDGRRVYVWGRRSVGQTAQALGCVDGISAVATSGPHRAPPACDEPAPAIHFAGLKDSTRATCMADYSTERALSDPKLRSLDDRQLPPLDELDEHNRSTRSCSGKRRQWRKSGKHRCWTWKCETPYVSCHLASGIRFPDTGKDIKCDGPPTDFDVARAVWDFFDAQTD